MICLLRITYIGVCFENLQSKTTTDITTHIRLDVAHFVHTIKRWKCFKTVIHSSVKKFYTYCICLLIDCSNIKSFEHILLLILVVCNNEDEDSIISINGETITPADTKSDLEKISSRNMQEFLLNVTQEINKYDFDSKNVKLNKFYRKSPKRIQGLCQRG